MDNMVFSHYEDKDGNPVTAIEHDIELYACYGIEIKDIKGLKAVNKAPNANYVLTNDITIGMSAMHIGSIDKIEWESLGNSSIDGFSGKFNGNGHIIRFNASAETLENFGLFSKISGMVYNLYVAAAFDYQGTLTKEAVLGTFAREVMPTGRVIDCGSCQTINLSTITNKKITIGGSIGVNYGLIDGFLSSMNGTILLENNSLSYIGSVIGANYGIVRNTTQTGRNGNIAIVLPRSPETYIGNLIGFNDGLLENSFVERAVNISFTDETNRYLTDKVTVSGIVGLNNGLINMCTFYNEDFHYNTNITIDQDLYLVALDYNKAIQLEMISVYLWEETTQGPMYILKYIIYMDENTIKDESDYWEEYTYSEFAKAYPNIYNKIKGIDTIVSYNNVTNNLPNGKINNISIVDAVGTGNITALVSSCNYNEIKWSYLRRLYATNYNKF